MFTTLFIQPIYNLFVYLLGFLPSGDLGLAIIIVTLLMRIILYPIFTASIRTQMAMQAMQGELDLITDKYKDNPQELAKQRMGLMKKHNVRPFAGFLALIVQFVLIIALYFALFREGFPTIDPNLLYSFVSVPNAVGTNFFGVNLLTPHNIILALIVGVTQYVAIRLTVMRTNTGTPNSPERAAAMRMQNNMMLYFMPVFISVIAYTLPAGVGLYFTVSNLVSIGQEWLIRRQFQSKNQ
ncbi:YidC/Oxa1 family membrane protein insertase [Candidatus Parcubacteria bacterium]|nr:YidC/Oxa1 family membrane protein insertase [Candidatus Parcubacteria bacterium]